MSNYCGPIQSNLAVNPTCSKLLPLHSHSTHVRTIPTSCSRGLPQSITSSHQLHRAVPQLQQINERDELRFISHASVSTTHRLISQERSYATTRSVLLLRCTASREPVWHINKCVLE